MNKIGDFNPNFNIQLIKDRLKIGSIVHLHSPYIVPPHNKFCIIVNAEPFVVFYINSEIPYIIKRNREKRKLQVTIPRMPYDFLDTDSSIDCSFLEVRFRICDVIQQIKNGSPFYDVKDELCEKMKKKIIKVVKNSVFLSEAIKRVIVENFS